MQKHRKNDFLTKNIVVCLLALVCCALWGSAFPCVKIWYRMLKIKTDDIQGQILYAGIRFTIAGIMVILSGSIAKHKILISRKPEFPRVISLSIFQTIIQYILFYIGLAHTSGVKASIIIGSNVFIAVIVSGLFFRLEKISANKIIGCITGFAGIIIINMSGGGLNMNFRLTGEGFMFISTFSYALSSVLMKKYSVSSDPVTLSGWQFLFGGAVMSFIGLVSGGHIHITPDCGLIMLLYLSFISAAAYSLWAVLLKYNPVSKVAVYGFMNPVIGVILSALLLDEGKQASGINSIIALILICIGIYTVNFSKQKSQEN